MRQQSWKLTILGTLVLAGGVQMPALAQTPPPHITSVTQSSGLRGTTIELKIAGVHIGQGTALVFEGDGLAVESLSPETPPAGQPPKPEGTLTAKVRIAADAEPGWRALRVLTPMGPSDLGHFAIGLWPEVAEKEPNNARAQAQEVKLPVTVIGKLDPAEDVDGYRFHAEAGQTLVFDVFAARMDSPVEPALTVQEEGGKEVALKEDFRREDLPMVFAVPKTGNYVLFLRDLRYQGSPNHVYRLTLGAIPYVTGAMPPGGSPGATLNLQLAGYNLGSAACRVTLPPEPASEPFARALSLPNGPSNPILLATGAFPEALQAGTNDSIANAQKLPVPATVSGRLARQNSAAGGAQADFYRFHAAQGQKLALEVVARRLGSPLDSVLTVLDASGKELASNDDDNGADSRLEFTAPQAGDYIARIADLNQRHGPDFVYRLTVRVPEPDFRLAFAPERLAIGQGNAIPLTVTATRLNGFDGEIALAFEGLPAGVRVIGPPQIPAGQAETLLLLAAAPDAPLNKADAFRITGTATLNGRPARRKAQPLLEEYVRNNNNQIERATRPSVLPMIAVAPPPDMTVTATPDHLTLAPGKTVEIKVKIARKEGFTAKVPLALLGLPAGITATTPEIAEKQTEATLTLKIEGDVKPGDSTLIVVGKAALDELRFVPHCALPLTLTVTK
ncbi:MAG TPA: PPC domain-containing protein [Chthonomonadaceae bacterium]|nr:PPC domain-containing protein [Chthonomonadaceae bacterium]